MKIHKSHIAQFLNISSLSAEVVDSDVFRSLDRLYVESVVLQKQWPLHNPGAFYSVSLHVRQWGMICLDDELLAIEILLELLDFVDCGEALKFNGELVLFTLQQFLAAVCDREGAIVILLS